MKRLVAALCLLSITARAEVPDPFLWLEDVSGTRAMDWVHQQNARSLAVLHADPHYTPFYAQSLRLAQSSDRIPTPTLIGGQVYNLWQDAAHVQGIWRRTSVVDYPNPSPHWQTVLDLDALSRTEGKHWVWKNVTCAEPAETRCLISLSDGGEDAVTTREFDLTKSAFVPGGFVLPHAKQSADWLNDDTVLVATDWGAGSMTVSGYPFVAKTLRRGQALADATEVFRGQARDVELDVSAMMDGQGNRATVLLRGIDAFHTVFMLVPQQGRPVALNLPQKATLDGLLDDNLILTCNQDFATAGGHVIKAGSIAALDLGKRGAAAQAIFTPNAKQSVDQVAAGKTRLYAATYDNVRGRAYAFSENPTAKGLRWSQTPLALPDDASIDLATTSNRDDRAYLTVTSFLQPTSLYQVDGDAAPVVVKSLPAKFDASKDVAEQYEVASTDGTKIPYFVVHPKTMRLDGTNPTLLYGYGGFQISMTPVYSDWMGKLWIEPGGVFVLANIRGGGEFGPAWHEAGLKTGRQIIYDDFAAVGKDLIARHITDPAHLGIRGGSNGGLLMGVEFEQHPELWKAVIIEVPLLDMMRYEKIAAGASWVGEYGSVSNPAERAFLARISPYANLKPGVKYPLPFIFTTTKDDRVGPQHARKFAAKMDAMGLPFLYYEETEGGHAAGANLQEIAEEHALEVTYLARMLSK